MVTDMVVHLEIALPGLTSMVACLEVGSTEDAGVVAHLCFVKDYNGSPGFNGG